MKTGTITDHELSKITEDWYNGIEYVNTGLKTAFVAGYRFAESQANGQDTGERQLTIPDVMPRIRYAEDWEGNKYEPCDINCKIDDEGKLNFETKALLGCGNSPLDLEPIYDA